MITVGRGTAGHRSEEPAPPALCVSIDDGPVPISAMTPERKKR